MKAPVCVFLDTNVYIIGAADPESPEREILRWAGFGQNAPGPVEVILSDVLIKQILRVAKRLRGKDWGGQLIGRIWRDLWLRYVLLDAEECARLETAAEIPREDIEIYLTARTGEAECFVSSNHVLIHALTKKTSEMECLTPEKFIAKYLHSS